MIDHTWMDDIEIGTNVFVANAHQDYLLTMTTSWRQKRNLEQSYILCRHLNCKCYLVNMTTTSVPCSTNIGIYAWFWFLKIYIYWGCQSQQSHNDENMFFIFERPQQLDFENYQVIWWFVKNICQNPRFCDRWWAKMIQLLRKHYSHQDVTFHPTPY